jgi:hypothetical protein
VDPIDPSAPVSLKWPRWYPTTADDRQKDAQSLVALVQAGCMSRDAVMKAIAGSYDIEFLIEETESILNEASSESGDNG